GVDHLLAGAAGVVLVEPVPAAEHALRPVPEDRGERGLQRDELGRVHHRDREQHDEQDEQQREHVRVGDQPARLAAFLLVAAYLAATVTGMAGPSAARAAAMCPRGWHVMPPPSPCPLPRAGWPACCSTSARPGAGSTRPGSPARLRSSSPSARTRPR